MDNEGRRHRLAALAGILTGAALGAMAVFATGSAVARTAEENDVPPWIDVTHLPPLLTVPGETVELRYDVHCSAAGARPDDVPCDASGNVFVRAGGGGPYVPLPLARIGDPTGGQLVARVPELLANQPDGFAYYAELASPAGASTTLPAGGAEAPQRSLPLRRTIDIALGRHDFGHARLPERRLVRAAWGSGTGEVGLEPGRHISPIGGSSFDVDPRGTVVVLDQANRRLHSWAKGESAPRTTELAIDGTLADLAIAGDGTIHLLESALAQRRTPLLRVFTPGGIERHAAQAAEGASQVRASADGGALALQQPSSQWMPVATTTRVLSPGEQRGGGRPGRVGADGLETVVLRVENEIRVALVGPHGVHRGWRIASETPLAEVQLAEPWRGGIVLVTRVYSDTEDEFTVLVLGRTDLERRFAVESLDWAETAPLSRFRFRDGALYRLGSTPHEVLVDRFDVEAR